MLLPRHSCAILGLCLLLLINTTVAAAAVDGYITLEQARAAFPACGVRTTAKQLAKCETAD